VHRRSRFRHCSAPTTEKRADGTAIGVQGANSSRFLDFRQINANKRLESGSQPEYYYFLIAESRTGRGFGKK
jgi:hypothetical protein